MAIDVTRIVFIGDSLIDSNDYTFQGIGGVGWAGWGRNNNGFWSAIVAKSLDSVWKNTGIGGDTIRNISTQLQARVFDFNPTVVIMDGGWNDVGAFPENNDKNNAAANMKKYLLSAMRQMLARDIQVVYVGIPMCSKGYNPWAPLASEFMKVPGIFVDVTNTLKAEHPGKVFFVNLEGSELGTTTTNPGAFPYQYRSDDLHFNYAGELLTAKNVLEQLYALDPTLKKRNKGVGLYREISAGYAI